MKALLISSSPHRNTSSTLKLAREVARGLRKEKVSVKEIRLHDCRVLFCESCETCHEKILRCPRRDDVPSILRAMLDADIIVLASPNYINSVTASMKALLDRSSHFIHCKRLLGKYVAGVVTSGSGMADMVLEYFGHYANTCGALYSGGVSAPRMFGRDKKEEAFALGRKLAADARTRKRYPKQMRAIEEGQKHFARIMQIRKNDWREEYRYWLDKGWL